MFITRALPFICCACRQRLCLDVGIVGVVVVDDHGGKFFSDDATGNRGDSGHYQRSAGSGGGRIRHRDGGDDVDESGPDQTLAYRRQIYQIQFLGALVRIRLEGETGKVDLNKASQVQLQQLMMAQLPIDRERPDRFGFGDYGLAGSGRELVNIAGAEKREYKEAGKLYQPRNKPFQSLEELQMVLGMDGVDFETVGTVDHNIFRPVAS